MVQGAWPRAVVAPPEALQASGLLSTFCAHALELEAAGAAAVTTSCGFLVLLQAQLQAAVKVPLVTSSLLQLPALLQRERQVGVLTISAENLRPMHLIAAGVPQDRFADVIVQGVHPDSEFSRAILGNRERMDLAEAGADVVAAAAALKARAPQLRTVVLECTNMPPYGDAIRQATGFELRSLLDDSALR